MDIIYREAEAKDALSLLTHLAYVGAETDNLSFGKDTFRITEEKEAKFIERFRRNKNDIMLVALDGDKVVGNAIIERNKVARYSHRAELSITVLRDYWSRGIGSRLMELLIDFAKNSGVEILYLEVRSDNESAISLYKKFGFRRIGIYDKFFKIGNEYHNADLMILDI